MCRCLQRHITNNPDYMESKTTEERLNIMGLSLPPAPDPVGVYKPYLIEGNYLYLSGHGPVQHDRRPIIGRIGKELHIEQGKLAARQIGLTILPTILKHIGTLYKIKRVIKVLGIFHCTPSVDSHPC